MKRYLYTLSLQALSIIALASLGVVYTSSAESTAATKARITNEAQGFVAQRASATEAHKSAQKHDALADDHAKKANAASTISGTITHTVEGLEERSKGAVEKVKREYHQAKQRQHKNNLDAIISGTSK